MNAILTHLPFVVAVAVAIAGLAVVLWRRNLILILMGMALVESAVNLFLVALGYRHDAVAPIYTGLPDGGEGVRMVLPTVQALTLTAIVIGLATTAMMLSLVIVIHRHYGTTDVRDVRRLRE